MSCFGGRMQEYDRISLDRFDGKNLQSTVYFLSHLHEDHTVGLAEKIFHKRLKSNKDIFLYCSEVTQILLLASKKYRHLKHFIKGLSINTPTTIDIPDPLFEEKEKITVTLLPAFHCPGSVMFLIEGAEGTVLYTGDFRWEHFNIEQMHHLRSGESVKKIKSLYVDTTFCSPENLYIPSRQQCIDAVCQLVQEWTSISPKHVVNIYLRAQYGHEPLLNAVASRLNKKVHVNEHKIGVYNRIQEFYDNFTSDGINTQLHACDKNCVVKVDGEEVLCSERHEADKVLVILPTTMYFTQFSHLTLDKIIKKINSNFFRACYSFHSSYMEVKDLISYLKPEKVFPNVKPPSDSSLAVTQHRLNKILKECVDIGAGEVIPDIEMKELGTLKTRSRRQANKRKERDSTSDAGSLDFGSPVKTAKLSFSSSLDSGEPSSPANSSTNKKGRGRGRRKADFTSQPAMGTRRSTRSAASPSPQKTTLKKSADSERSATPDLFLTPASDTSDQHSSFGGSEGNDSELSLFSSQKSIGLPASGDVESSWTGGSFLAAVCSSSEDDTGAGRYCLLDDEEQTDEHFEDCCPFTDTEEEDNSFKESAISQDDVDIDPDEALAKRKGKTERTVQLRTGERRGKSKPISVKDSKDDVVKEHEQNISDDKKHVNVEKSNLKDKEKDQIVVSNEDKIAADDDKIADDNEITVDDNKITETESVLNESGSSLRKENSNKDERVNEIDSIIQGDDIKSEVTNTSDRDKYNEDVHWIENKPSDVSEEHKDIVFESSEELHLQLSQSSGSVDVSFAENVNMNIDEIVVIDSDSGDEVTRVDVGNDCSRKSKACSNVEAESYVKLQSSDSRSNSPSAIIIADSDSNEVCQKEVKDDDENRKYSANAECSINLEHKQCKAKDGMETEDVQIVETNDSAIPEFENDEAQGRSLKEVTVRENCSYQIEKHDIDVEMSDEAEEFSKDKLCTNDGDTETDKAITCDNISQNIENDDVVEIVDLTFDEYNEVENKESTKPGKKAIKISLLTRTENLKKSIKESNTKTYESEKDELICSDGGDESDSDGIDGSQEWLSVKKARITKGISGKRNHIKGKKRHTAMNKVNERTLLEEKEQKDLDTDEDENLILSKKEMDERAEVRRQAVGFICETDSESDTDESTDPGSPTAGLLYDDYVELSSGSDNEDGTGENHRGGKTDGKNYKNARGSGDISNVSSNNECGNSDQGWLNSRKHVADSQLQETSLDDINTPVDKDQSDSMVEHTDMQNFHLINDNRIDESCDNGMTSVNIPSAQSSSVTASTEENSILLNTTDQNISMKEQIGKSYDDKEKKNVEDDYVEPIDKADAENVVNNVSMREQNKVGNSDKTVVESVSNVAVYQSESADCIPDKKSSERLNLAEKFEEEKGINDIQCKDTVKADKGKKDVIMSANVTGIENELIKATQNRKFEKINENDKNQEQHRKEEKENLSLTGKRKVESVSKSTMDNKNDKKTKSSKVIDWRKLPQACVSKIDKVNDLIIYNDEPAPPGTEEEVERLKPYKTAKSEQGAKAISSLISKTRPAKVNKHNSSTSITKPPPATSVHSQPYNSFQGVNSALRPPSYNYSYPYSAAPPYPPPVWGQFPYRQPSPNPFNFPAAFSGIPPSVPYQPPSVQYPPPVSVQTTSSASVPTAVVTVPSSSQPPETLPSATSVATSSIKSSFCLPKQSNSIQQNAEDESDSKQSVTHSLATKQKKLAPWQQKKLELFDRGPSCIAKKKVKKKTEMNIRKSKHKDQDDTELFQSGHESKFSYKETGITDLATIKANISALTGLSVQSNLNTNSNSQAVNEDLPTLVEQLNKLQKVQAVLDAMKPQSVFNNEIKDTNQCDMSQQATYINSRRDDDKKRYDDFNRRERPYDDFGRREQHKDDFDRRERPYDDFGRREPRYDNFDRREQHYDDFRRKERLTYEDFEHREKDFRSYERRERNVQYERDRNLEYRERRTDVIYERHNRNFRDGRDYLEYERREREFEQRYREEEEYRMWLQDRRQRDDCRVVRRGSPPKYPGFDEPHYINDSHYNRQARGQEFEEWRERQRLRETHSRVRHDTYERYDYELRQQPPERWRPHLSHESHPYETSESSYRDPNDTISSEENYYGTELGSEPRSLKGTRDVQVSQSFNSGRGPTSKTFQKKPVLARVISRSGQLLSTQSGWKAGHIPASSTVTEDKTTTDEPVFLTGINYYDQPADQ